MRIPGLTIWAIGLLNLLDQSPDPPSSIVERDEDPAYQTLFRERYVKEPYHSRGDCKSDLECKPKPLNPKP